MWLPTAYDKYTVAANKNLIIHLRAMIVRCDEPARQQLPYRPDLPPYNIVSAGRSAREKCQGEKREQNEMKGRFGDSE